MPVLEETKLPKIPSVKLDGHSNMKCRKEYFFLNFKLWSANFEPLCYFYSIVEVVLNWRNETFCRRLKMRIFFERKRFRKFKLKFTE